MFPNQGRSDEGLKKHICKTDASGSFSHQPRSWALTKIIWLYKAIVVGWLGFNDTFSTNRPYRAIKAIVVSVGIYASKTWK